MLQLSVDDAVLASSPTARSLSETARSLYQIILVVIIILIVMNNIHNLEKDA